MDSLTEAVIRMKRRNSQSVRWTLKDRVIEYKYIPATAAKNWDGSAAGCGNDPNQTILQRMTWWDGMPPRFTN